MLTQSWCQSHSCCSAGVKSSAGQCSNSEGSEAAICSSVISGPQLNSLKEARCEACFCVTGGYQDINNLTPTRRVRPNGSKAPVTQGPMV